jgi:hypothetical protein
MCAEERDKKGKGRRGERKGRRNERGKNNGRLQNSRCGSRGKEDRVRE